MGNISYDTIIKNKTLAEFEDKLGDDNSEKDEDEVL